MEPWRTAIVNKDKTNIWLRGYDIRELMSQVTFAGVVWLLHTGRLPTAAEEKLFNALLIGSADHGSGAPSCATARLAASGNRESLSAAVAAGVLAIGDVHGGAGARLMEIIGEVVAEASAGGHTLAEAAAAFVRRERERGARLPGFGHRVHTVDPRVDYLFDMAKDLGLAGAGIDCVRALHAALVDGGADLPINIDGAFAANLYDLGLPPAAGKLLFIVGRVGGITAEVAEEHAREKPMRIRIPLTYDGEPPRKI